MESERCPDTDYDAYDNYNWLWKQYGIDAGMVFEKYRQTTCQQNPYIPEGGYVPLDLAKDDPTKSDPFSLHLVLLQVRMPACLMRKRRKEKKYCG